MFSLPLSRLELRRLDLLLPELLELPLRLRLPLLLLLRLLPLRLRLPLLLLRLPLLLRLDRELERELDRVRLAAPRGRLDGGEEARVRSSRPRS